eukprot:NODE_152_length_15391_cov_0.883272.p22 type:complete len:106 gc:universal NODE_152_length_15391_cov_0.883272:8018-7701(-)
MGQRGYLYFLANILEPFIGQNFRAEASLSMTQNNFISIIIGDCIQRICVIKIINVIDISVQRSVCHKRLPKWPFDFQIKKFVLLMLQTRCFVPVLCLNYLQVVFF